MTDLPHSGEESRLRVAAFPMSRRLAAPMLCALLALQAVGSALAEVPAQDRRHELVRLVRQDCGSCHGMTLKGGLGPPLTPAALTGKPLDSLVATVMNGRPGTPMPPWQRFLSEDEARWVVEQLILGFPSE